VETTPVHTLLIVGMDATVLDSQNLEALVETAVALVGRLRRQDPNDSMNNLARSALLA
jgi:hypothetical protein